MSSLRVSGPVSSLDEAARVLLFSGCFSPETPALRSGSEARRDDRIAAAENELLSLIPEGFADPEGERIPDEGIDDVLAEAATYTRRLRALNDRASATEKMIAGLRESEETLSHFADADLDVARLSRMEFTSFATGVLPTASYETIPSLRESEKIQVVKCSESSGSTWVTVLFPKGREDAVWAFLSGLGF
ncbi:MAG: hypothetical protein IKN36_04165, partial [Clostridia bacterium]|nr:hypothetical protein [Clostridia bacterium]